MTPATEEDDFVLQGRMAVKHRKRVRSVASSSRSSLVEPDFAMMLADPEIQMLMRADGVDEIELLNLLKEISVRLREDEPKDRMGPGYRIPHPEVRKYRRGVGMILLNSRFEVFIARRNDVVGNAWQMPQGGIDPRETPRQAAYWELKEEIGTNKADIIAESNGWFYYDVPAQIALKAWGGKWKGQRQKWFVMNFTGLDADIDLRSTHAEFDTWRWATLDEVRSLAVSFKRQLYVSLLAEFAKVLQPPGGTPSDFEDQR